MELTEEQKKAAELAAQQARETELEEQAREAERAQIRAEAERDTIKGFLDRTKDAKPEAAHWTEEQWAAWTEKNGFTKDQAGAIAGIAEGLANQKLESFNQRSKEQEEKSKKLEDRLEQADFEKSVDKGVRSFLDKNKGLERFRSEIDDFLNDYSKDQLKEPKTLERLLEKSLVYIKGKVGGPMRQNVSEGQRFGGGSSGESSVDNVDEQIYDWSGLTPPQKEFAKTLVHSKEELKVVEKHKSSMFNGVEMDGKEQWDKALEGTTLPKR